MLRLADSDPSPTKTQRRHRLAGRGATVPVRRRAHRRQHVPRRATHTGGGTPCRRAVLPGAHTPPGRTGHAHTAGGFRGGRTHLLTLAVGPASPRLRVAREQKAHGRGKTCTNVQSSVMGTRAAAPTSSAPPTPARARRGSHTWLAPAARTHSGRRGRAGEGHGTDDTADEPVCTQVWSVQVPAQGARLG